MNILADASLPGLDQAFPKPFHVTRYDHPQEIAGLLPGQKVLLCRSTLKVNSSLLTKHHLDYVATASSGTDHIDYHWLQTQNIQLLDAKGSNACAVADYVLACLAFLEQQNLIHGMQAGIIGLGKVGTQVASRLQAAKFQTQLYDPPKSVREAQSFQTCSIEDLYHVDLLCIHAELHNMQPYPSLNLINQHFLDQLKPGCIIINASRGGVINEEDLLKAQKPLTYCTDVYLNEPAIDQRIIDKALLCTPHIAGHSLEAKYLAVAMISEKLHQCAGIPIPRFATPQLPQPLSVQNYTTGYEALLEIYNPLVETLELKHAINKETAFLSSRKNHQNRHDFSLYFQDLNMNSSIDKLSELRMLLT